MISIFNLFSLDWSGMFIHILFATGLVLYIIGHLYDKLQSFSPIGNLLGAPYALVIRTVGVILMLVSIYYQGAHNSDLSWEAKLDNLAAQVKVAEQKAIDANGQIETKIIYKTKVITKTVQVEKEKLKEYSQKIDSECKVSPEAIEIINSAAKGAMK